MKNLLTSAVIVILTVSGALAQSKNFTQAMTEGIQAINGLNKAQPDVRALQDISAKFEGIAAAEPKEWLPKYYAAYCNIMLGYVGGSLNEKDQYLEKGAALLKDAEAILGKPNDELLVLKAFHAQIHLAADPMNRWQYDGARFAEYLEAAKTVNPDNPRIYYLEGSNVFFTPEEYGGGKKVARPLLEKAKEKFSTFKPGSEIAPDWGKAETEWMLTQSN